MALPGVRQFPALMFARNDFRKMKSAIISVLVLARKYFRKIKRSDCRALSSQGRFTDIQCSHLIARSPCDFCPKRRSIPGHPSGARLCSRATLVCTYVPGHHSGAQICPAPFRSSYVPERSSGAHMCLDTIPAPICVRTPFQRPYVSGHHSSAHMCPSTIPAPICARATFLCPFRPEHSSGGHMGP